MGTPRDALERHVHVPDDPIDFIPPVSERAGEVVPEIAIEQEPQHDQREGVVHDAARELNQEQDGRDAEEHVQGVRQGRASEKQVQVGEGVDDSGHPEGGQADVHPHGPAAGVLGHRVGEKGQGENEPQVDHAERVGLDGDDGAVNRPTNKGGVEDTDENSRVAAKLAHDSSLDPLFRFVVYAYILKNTREFQAVSPGPKQPGAGGTPARRIRGCVGA